MAKKTTAQRGYGNDHQIIRKKWQRIIDQGETKCARCGKPIQPDMPWDLGHTEDRTGYNGPECVPCNRGAGARNSTRARIKKEQTTNRDW
ncbi:HNH endonuclease [Arthrobacter phage 1191A]|nr:HNH endonuclease [Arthrobacter phage 1191A]